MSIKVKYMDLPDHGAQSITVSGEGQPFSDAREVLNERNQEPFGTLEDGGWPLDGSRRVMPDTPQGTWWSKTVSNETGNFIEPPALTLILPSLCTATGISICFAPETGDFCSGVRISWLRGSVLLASTEAAPDGPRWSLQQTVEDFDTVRLEFLRTDKPKSFAKVSGVTVGLVHWFLGDELISVQLQEESDPLLSTLTVDAMTIKLRDKKGRDLRPRQNQKVELYQGERLLATHHIVSSTRQDGSSYCFSCQGTLGLLEDDFLGGFYENAPVQQVIKEVLGDIDYETDSVFEGQTLTGYLPVCSRRQALQQIGFSLGAVISTRGDGKVRFLPPQTAVSHAFRKDQIFHGGSVKTSARVARAEVSAHSFALSREREELLREEWVEGENVLFTFQNPHHSYEISGGTLTESGANFVRISAQGPVTLSAGKYLQNTCVFVREEPVIHASERGNLLRVTDATLIHKGNARAVLERLWAGAKLRQELSFEAVASDQYPGQAVSTVDLWGGLMQGYITAMDRQLTKGGQTACVTVCGNTVPAQIAAFYSGELYSGEEVAHLCS